MSIENQATAQFSVYKICAEEVEQEFKIEGAGETEDHATEIITALINNTIKLVEKRPFSQNHQVSYSGFRGVFFKTVHKPSWEGIANEVIEGNEFDLEQKSLSRDFLQNTNISYVLFFAYCGIVYAITGGYGSNYISKYVEKNFGLYLLPKVIEENNPVIKSIMQNNLLGNQTAMQKTNKQSTAISLEQDMSSIFRQLNVELDRGVAEKLGIEFDEDESQNKKVNIVNKDSLVIRRSISLSELKTLIKKIYELEQAKDKFALNYLVLAKKKRIKNADLFDELIATLLNEEFEKFAITGDDYTTYYTGADRYILYNEKGDELLNQSEPITFLEVVNQIPKDKYSKSAFRRMLKEWTISTTDNNGTPIIYKLTVFGAMQGFVEYGKIQRPCFLFNGLWYVFDEKFSDALSSSFEKIYSEQTELINEMKNTFGLRIKAPNEDEYNELLLDNASVVFSYTVLLDYVEIADAIFWDNKTIYLMHNKTKFSGSGARDVTNQVLVSAEYLQQNLYRDGKLRFLGRYYDSICKKYKEKGKTISVSKEKFVEIFEGNREIKYVIGYIKDYKKTSRSTYAKYLTVETRKKLAAKGFSCVALDLSS